MLSYIKNNHLSILIILFLVLSPFFTSAPSIGNPYDITSITNPFVFNQDSEDIDYRFEGNSDANLLYTDAGNDRVGIGDATPETKLDVAGALQDGGGRLATSTDDTTATFLVTDFDTENFIEFTPNVASITATLPATSTITTFLSDTGDHREYILCNATTTAATPFTLALGTGMNEHNATSTLSIGTGQCAVMDWYRAADTDIEVFVGVGQ